MDKSFAWKICDPEGLNTRRRMEYSAEFIDPQGSKSYRDRLVY